MIGSMFSLRLILRSALEGGYRIFKELKSLALVEWILGNFTLLSAEEGSFWFAINISRALALL